MQVEQLDIPVKLLHPDARLPEWGSDQAAGCDIRCVGLEESGYWCLDPGESAVLQTGLSMQIPDGYYAELWDRSGMGAKRNIHRLAGVIDSDYRGEWMVCLINLSDTMKTIENGDKIIQAIFKRRIRASFQVVDDLDETDRGSNGFGSTGR